MSDKHEKPLEFRYLDAKRLERSKRIVEPLGYKVKEKSADLAAPAAPAVQPVAWRFPIRKHDGEADFVLCHTKAFPTCEPLYAEPVPVAQEPAAWVAYKTNDRQRDVVSIGAKCPPLWSDEAVPLYAAPVPAIPPETMQSETGWLIEVQGAPSPLWLRFNGSATADANEAIRFCRKVDADGFLEVFISAKFGDDVAGIYRRRLSVGTYVVTEHMWPLASAPASPAVPPLTIEQIIDIRDQHLPSQGERFDWIAFARDLIAVVPRSPAVPQDVKDAYMRGLKDAREAASNADNLNISDVQAKGIYRAVAFIDEKIDAALAQSGEAGKGEA